MSDPDPAAEATDRLPGSPSPGRGLLRLFWDHAGRISAALIGAVAFIGLLFLAAIGFTPALVLVIVVVVGFVLIVLGGRVRG